MGTDEIKIAIVLAFLKFGLSSRRFIIGWVHKETEDYRFPVGEVFDSLVEEGVIINPYPDDKNWFDLAPGI